MAKLCPQCGCIMVENPYFQKNMCTNCNYTEDIKPISIVDVLDDLINVVSTLVTKQRYLHNNDQELEQCSKTMMNLKNRLDKK